jgi:hypothetical protein
VGQQAPLAGTRSAERIGSLTRPGCGGERRHDQTRLNTPTTRPSTVTSGLRIGS